ncbi:isopropylmalate isomerase [Pacificoceanicola onchidii]|uniref:isopropylmalate isomerase n=1 Tax=Pacificoceanicola onchidii TaxID=2562685 RepID=UPI001981BFED|nr:isopropylmalate isomerase [Pacificoceanicola onchidii]
MDSLTLPELLACVEKRWSPVIGDPSIMGWATVAAYALAGCLALYASRVRRRDRRFWLFLGVLLLALCINKQLDLQSALTATGRCISKLQGWYDERRAFQAKFIIALLGISTLVLSIALYRMRRAFHRVGLALIGFAVLLTFVAIRAVGMHHFDAVIRMELGGMRMNWILELSGILLILVNAIYAIRGRRKRRKHSRGAADPNMPFNRNGH